MNIQGVCDSNLKFLNIVAKRTGSAHDAFICSNSGLNDILVNGTITDGWLLGEQWIPIAPIAGDAHPKPDISGRREI